MSFPESSLPSPLPNLPQRAGAHSDRLFRKYMGNPPFAAEVINHYTDSVFRQHVDTSALQPAPTNFVTKELRERIKDMAFVAALLDKTNHTELLFTFEAKSRPTVFAPLQLWVYSGCSSFLEFAEAGYPESFGSRFRPRIPIMVLVYSGTEDIDEELWFQSIYENLPDWVKEFVPQFRIVVINLRKYIGGEFPGPPEVRAWAEALVRISDGTLTANLDGIFGNFRNVPLNEQIREMMLDILEICCKRECITEAEIDSAILKVFTGQEGLEMLQTAKIGFYQEAEARGVTIGEARGEARGVTIGEARGRVLAILQIRFDRVPKATEAAVRSMVDVTALESLAMHAKNCKSLDEFDNALK